MDRGQRPMHISQSSNWGAAGDRKKVTYLIALICLSAILLLTACGGEETSTPAPSPTAAPQPTATPTANSSFITGLVLAQDTEGAEFTPVGITEQYSPEHATFHAVVTLENAPANTVLRAVWTLVQAAGYNPNTKIDENELTVAEGGSRNVDFTLNTPENRWPPGTYKVEIFANDELAASKEFTVTGADTPSTAGVEVLKQVVLAEDTQPGTFEPVRPTTTFQHDIPFIHAAIQVEDAPPNTVFRARWSPPTQESLDFNLTTDGTRWLDFRLTPAPDGFPTGDYRVEIYVNDQLADAKNFTVE